MAARGSESKNIITTKLLETFAGSFIYDKNVIIPMVENGESLQIKIALTCAKTNVSPNGENVLPGEDVATEAPASNVSQTSTEITQEEKDNIKKMMEVLGL